MTATLKVLNLRMEEKYFSKKGSTDAALEILNLEKITGMTVSGLAAEIFAHAYVYYKFDKLPGFIKNTGLAKHLYNCAADGIDLEDNGDSLKRRVCYRLIWIFARGK